MAQLQIPRPTQNAVSAEAMNEALRRRAQLGPSTATLGAPTANSPSPENPLAQGLNNPQIPSGGAAGAPPGAGGVPTDGAISALGQQKGEAEKIVSVLAARLKVLGERNQ